MLRALMAVSADGFVCRGPADDMEWTGAADKRLFASLTRDQVVGAGSTTCRMLPPLPGRTVKRITREARGLGGGAEWTLGDFARAFPEGWLIGGQTVLTAAIYGGLVDRVVLSHVEAELGEGQEDRITPLLHSLGWRSRLFPLNGLSVVTWNREPTRGCWS